MFYALMDFLTDFGDSAVTGAFALAIAIFLLMYKEKRAALAIITVFMVTAVLIALGKIILYSRSSVLSNTFFDLGSPSGHAGISLAVYGTVAAIISSAQADTSSAPTRGQRIIPYLFAVPLIALIAASRVILHNHTLSDVLVGAGIGFVSSFGVWWFLLRGKTIHCPWWSFALIALIVLGLTHGLHFPAEKIIDSISRDAAGQRERLEE